MRHSGLHSPAQEIAAEAFSDDAPEPPAGSGGPVYVRSRANPLALVKPGQVPAAPPPPEPPQVRFWRTPDRLIGSVWARGGAEALLPEEEADAMAEQPVVALPDDVVIDAALADKEERAPATPFDLLSDHAFWEVVAAEMAEEEAGGQAAAAPHSETAIASPPPRPVEPMVAKPSARNTVQRIAPQPAASVRVVATRPVAPVVMAPVAIAQPASPAPAPIARPVGPRLTASGCQSVPSTPRNAT